MSKPVVSIVGRANVGKSTLFNKLIGQRLSITQDTPGVTRDRIYGDCEWGGTKFSLVDTGGFEPYDKDEILKNIRDQAKLAIETSDVVIFVTDVRSGVVSTDYEVASMLKKSSKPIILCVNKCDSVGDPPEDFYEFYNLGLGQPFAVSSVHGHGTGDLLDEVLKYLPSDDYNEEKNQINVAILGKPNAGKSSLINKIVGFNRSIVSNIAGTTRDSIDSSVSNEFGNFNFIDTAGLRRKSKVEELIEKYSVIRAKLAIDRSDVCLILIDAEVGFTEQDAKIAGLCHNAGKASLVLVNKWDLIEKDSYTQSEFKKDIQKGLSFMKYAKFLFISAKTGFNVNKLYSEIKIIEENTKRRITTGLLNDILADSIVVTPPPTDKGKRLKIYYVTQVSVAPPTFVFFVNKAELFHFSYQRYLENRFRETFSLEGTPIKFIIREKTRE